MPQYEYQGINASGKSVKGRVIMDSMAMAKSHLRREGIFPSHISEVSLSDESSTKGIPLRRFFTRVSTEELATATRQLATLTSANVPLIEGLTALTDQIENQKLKAAFAQVKSDVNEGATFSKALSRYPDIFSELYFNMVGSGESSGALDIVLNRLADFLEYQDRLRKKIFSALLYPAIMVVVGLGALLFIFTAVIPEIARIFEENKQVLPLLTQVMLAISGFILDYWWAVLITAVIVFEILRRFLKSETGRRRWDDTKLRLPLFGDLVRMIAVSRFTKTLATMLRSGIPLLVALKAVRPVVGNRTIQRAIEQASTDLAEGANIADPLRRSGQFPPLVTHMISVGEKTGELENMLEKVAEHYEYQVNTRVQQFTSLLEPIMILVMAGMVGIIVLSVILPMLDMNAGAL